MKKKTTFTGYYISDIANHCQAVLLVNPHSLRRWWITVWVN